MRSLTLRKWTTPPPPPEDSSDLLTLDSRDIADPAVIGTVGQIEKLGEEQHAAYVKEWLVSQTM